MTTDQSRQEFTCPDCGHVTTYEPAHCWRGIRTRHGQGWRQEERYLVVRCAGCGRQQEVVTGPG
jgi:ribosomal protein S27E